MITQERANALLTSHKERLFECITSGVVDYSKYPARLRQDHTPRTRANIRHDHVVARIKSAFDGVVGAETIELKGLFLLLIDNILAIRFNKLSDDGRCHSNATEQTSLFHNQLPLPQQEELPGIPAHATHLIGGYTLNQLGTAAAAVTLSCPVGDDFAWQIPLTAPIAQAVNLADRRAEAQPEEKPRQVRGRKNPKIATEANKDDADG